MDVMSHMWKNIEEVEKVWGEEVVWKLIYVKGVIFLYRRFASCGIRFRGLVAIVAEEALLNDLRGCFEPTLMAASMNERTLRGGLFLHNSDVILIKGNVSSNAVNTFRFLDEICRDGFYTDESGDPHISDPVFVVFQDGIPSKYQDFFEGKIRFPHLNRTSLKKMDNMRDEFHADWLQQVNRAWSIVEYKMARGGAEKEEDGMLIINGVCEFLKVLAELSYLPEQQKHELKEKIEGTADMLKKDWYIESSDEDWEKLFIDLMFDAPKVFSKILDRKNTAEMDVETLKESAIADDLYYYFPEEIFKKMIYPISKIVGDRALKELLARDGFIKKEGRYYTVHVPILMKDGTVVRPRRVAINRRKIDRPGYLSLMDAIQMKGD